MGIELAISHLNGKCHTTTIELQCNFDLLIMSISLANVIINNQLKFI